MPKYLQNEGITIEDTIFKYIVYDKDGNKIEDKGCKYLLRGRWLILSYLNLGYFLLKKMTI